jgi:hypothetical protein
VALLGMNYNPRAMPPYLLATTAFLLVAFVFLCAVTWRFRGGRSQVRPFMERAAFAGTFALVGWQALRWLLIDQPAVSQARVFGVWVQLFSAFGIAFVMVAQGWLVRLLAERK